MQDVRFEGLTLHVESVQRSIGFYGEKLGFSVEINRAPHFAIKQRAGRRGGTIVLLPIDVTDSASSMTPKQRADIHIELTTDHLDALYERLKARGVEFF